MLGIARIAVREGLRQKLLYLFLGLGGLLLLLLFSRPQNIRFDDRPVTDPVLMTQVGLWTSLVFTSLLAVFLAMNAIGSERERGTTHLVLVRPVGRGRYWLERWLGVTVLAWLSVAVMLGALALALALRCGAVGALPVLAGLATLPLAAACVTAAVVAINTRFAAALSGFAGLVLVFLGLSRGGLQLAASATAGLHSRLLALASLLTPPLDEVVPCAMRLARGEAPDPWSIHHAVVYAFVCVVIGLVAFRRQEL